MHPHSSWHTGGLDPTTAMVIFCSFNILIFVVMLVAYYLLHDELLLEVFAWREKLAAAKQRLQAAHRAYARTYSNRVNALSNFRTRGEAVCTEVRRLIEVYRTANLRARRDRSYPKSYGKYEDINIPVEFDHISWQAPPEARAAFATILSTKEIQNVIDASDPAIAAALHQQDETTVDGRGASTHARSNGVLPTIGHQNR